MGTNVKLTDKEIIEEQKKTIRVLQTEDIRLTAELRRQKVRVKNSRIELIDKKI